VGQFLKNILIPPKVTQKMNFPMDQAVFHDLVTLNVNDSILVPKKSYFLRMNQNILFEPQTPTTKSCRWCSVVKCRNRLFKVDTEQRKGM